MADTMDKEIATQIANIEKKTGRSLAQLTAAIGKSGKAKHGEIRSWLMESYGLGHGDANTLTHVALKSDRASAAKAAGASTDDVLGDIYAGKKAHLRPIHDKLMAAIASFGEHEMAPKKGYVSLRRKKQFAMLGPKTNERFELRLNLKDNIDDTRVKPVPPRRHVPMQPARRARPPSAPPGAHAGRRPALQPGTVCANMTASMAAASPGWTAGLRAAPRAVRRASRPRTRSEKRGYAAALSTLFPAKTRENQGKSENLSDRFEPGLQWAP